MGMFLLAAKVARRKQLKKRWGDNMSVTTDPWLIAIINMTIVFGVLYALGLIMTLVRIIDEKFVMSK